MRKLNVISVTSAIVLAARVLAFIYLIIIRPSLSGNLEPEATIPPQISRIVFVGNPGGNERPLYTIAPDGTYLTRITSRPGTYMQPNWSPDGSRIAYVYDPDGRSQDLYVINADGSNEIQLTTSPEFEFGPEWSPDGSQLVYQDITGFYVISASGGDPQQVAPAGYAFAKWSPDGGLLAMIYDQPGAYRVTVVDPATGKMTNLSTLEAEPAYLVWSPDGSLITIPTSTGNGNSMLYVIHMDGSSPPTEFSLPGQNVRAITWSPDGQSLAMYKWLDGGNADVELYVTDYSGEHPQKLLSLSAPWPVTWSPDSTQMVVQWQAEPGGDAVLYVVNRDGSGAEILSTAPLISAFMPDWSPYLPGPIPTPANAEATVVPTDVPTELATSTATPTTDVLPTLTEAPLPTLNPDVGLVVKSFSFWPETSDPLDRETPFEFGASVDFTSQGEIGGLVLGFLLYADEAIPMPGTCMSGQMPPEHPERPFWSSGELALLPAGDQAWQQSYLYNEPVAGTTQLAVWLVLRSGDVVIYCEQRVYELTP